MSALQQPKITPAPQVHSRPADQERVKRKMEANAELAVDLVKEMFEDHVANNTKPSKDDIAIMEHTHSNAIRVFNLGAGAKTLAPLEEPKNDPKGFAGLKVFGAKKDKPPKAVGADSA
jgi:hypothetical protein